MTNLTPTDEQRNALDLFQSGGSLAIEAGAGTGKTSTLQLLGESTNRRGQYIAFNKAIVEESKQKMPGHVSCNTAHSLAFREVGKRYKHRLNSGRMRSTDLAARLGINEGLWIETQDGQRKQMSRTFLAGLTMRTVVRFCQSADTEPLPQHVPYIDGIDIPPGRWENNTIVRAFLLPFVARAWADLQNLQGSLPYRHDHYLKQWQLSNPRIAADFILFDEAQDANPVMVAIVAAQRHAQLVWVGDSQQQIYSFTGALNALVGVPADQRAFLTRSFRFGPAIAEVANEVLEKLDAELRLTGTDSIQSTVGAVAQPAAILTRTNAEAVRAVLNAKGAGQRPHLVGGGGEFSRFAKAADELMQRGHTDHSELACFDSWGEVRDYVAQDEQGSELRLNVRLIDEFSVAVIIDALERMPREENADLIVSTAHKSKGREWASVQLGGDFPPEPEGEELRLLYVGCTRAKERLDNTAAGFFTVAELVADVPRPDPPAHAVGEPVECAECGHLHYGGGRLYEVPCVIDGCDCTGQPHIVDPAGWVCPAGHGPYATAAEANPCPACSPAAPAGGGSPAPGPAGAQQGSGRRLGGPAQPDPATAGDARGDGRLAGTVALPVYVPRGNPAHRPLARLASRLMDREAAETRLQGLDAKRDRLMQQLGRVENERSLIVALLDPEKQAHYEED